MKKYIFVGFIFLLFSFSFLFSNVVDNRLLILASDYKAEVEFYVSTPQKINDCDCILNGNSNIIKCNYLNAQDIFLKLKNLVGISVKLQGERKEFLDICDLLDLKIITQENINNNITSYLCYTNRFLNIINIDNKKINIQIARNKDRITIGTPIILGAY